MNKLLWLVGGTVLALAAFAILNAPDPTSADNVEGAAGNLLGWGTKQRAAGAGNTLLGKAETFAGNIINSPRTSTQGTLDQATGAVRDAAGQTAQSLGQTLHLNQS